MRGGSSQGAAPTGPLFGGSVRTTSLFKPTGIPRGMNPLHPLYQGCLYFAWDTGLGYYVVLRDCFPGHGIYKPLLYNAAGQPGGGAFTNGTLPPVSAYRWGQASKWVNSAGFSPNYATVTSYIWSGTANDTFRQVQDLRNLGTGAACSIVGCYMKAGGSASGVVCGRVIPEATPYFVLASDNSNDKMTGGWYDGSAGHSLTSTTSLVTGAVNVSALTAYNTSAGVSTLDLIHNGVVEATSTGQTVADLGVDSGAEQEEGQFNIGQFNHLTANHADIAWEGAVPWVGMFNRRIRAAEIAFTRAAPFNVVIW